MNKISELLSLMDREEICRATPGPYARYVSKTVVDLYTINQSTMKYTHTHPDLYGHGTTAIIERLTVNGIFSPIADIEDNLRWTR